MNPAPLRIETFLEPSFGENGYVLATTDDQGRMLGWVIDPSFPPQADRILAYLQREGIHLERIVLTHGHVDHIAGVDAIRKVWPRVPVAMPAAEHGAFSNPEDNVSELIGMPMAFHTRPDEDLPAGSELRLGTLAWQVLDVSGHSPAGRALYCPQAGVVFTGDALFSGSIGRTDFPGADQHRLLRNIRTSLYTLADETVVYSGHGPPTTIGNERKFNPYVSD